MYRTAEWLPNQSAEAYRSVLDNVFRIYNIAGFRITSIHCDNEFQPLMSVLQDIYNVHMNYANPQEHHPEAERSNCTIKEQFCAAFHRLPSNKILKIMVKILAMESAKKLNFFPPKSGVSPYYSPHMIMHQQSINYNKHFSITFGSYVQAHTEPFPRNSQHPRTLDCIYLRYVDNDQGGHQLLDLRTGQMIKHIAVPIVPITKVIINLVHAMTTNDKMPNGIKIETNSGMSIYDSSWIAGVDYNNDDENTENDSTYSDGDDNRAESKEEENFDETANKIAELL
jgi:hypothetical protein